MRFTHDKKIRKSIIKLFTLTEQVTLLKSFALVKNETSDDFTAWIKWLAYENMESVKRATLFFIIIAIALYIMTSKTNWLNYLFFIYLSVSFLRILEQAKNIGYSYSIGIKLFLFALTNRIFFKPRSEHNSSKPINKKRKKIHIEKNPKLRELIIKTFTFKEQLALIRTFSFERETTDGNFLAWIIIDSDASFSSSRMMLICIFILFIVSIIQQPDAIYYISLIFLIVMLPISILTPIISNHCITGYKFITCIKLSYFQIKVKLSKL
ncbi:MULTISPECIES: hypothetical protein [Xenorhabdus]|uniref:Uncharacterized protein n=1 Tax=Xenorhabdus mauleonii TaxID=351675 RepID=A0A1I3W2A8_9GAMM|nr:MULTISPECIES: hypothetical protein [Xenorhabdus]MBD2792035.1 hypothetical protein [Xenorhabdus sp. CUL]MBD2823951.1 hypothetical protein [Xenorhabdus sp. 5]PHM38880.1 hypothetical protein Xmau_03257 [Xenorhabdus mauleonii]SFK01738.1 hypothetical protein SAMN05421680_12414 [Xenorhabdus mauleonii]